MAKRKTQSVDLGFAFFGELHRFYKDNRGRIRQHSAAVPDVDVPQSGKRIDVAVAFRVPDVDAVTVGEDERTTFLELTQIGDRVEHIMFVFGHEIGGVPCFGHGHRALSLRLEALPVSPHCAIVPALRLAASVRGHGLDCCPASRRAVV